MSMGTGSSRHWAAVASILLAMGFSVSPVVAAIGLEFRPAGQTVNLGDTVGVGLYAVSDSSVDQLLSAADVIFGWDNAVLMLIGLDQTGAAPLLASFFPAGDPHGLNEAVPPADGDGLYTAWANLGSPVAATPAGTLLTTFLFSADALTPGTDLLILPSGGNPIGYTTVWDGTTANTPVTGTLQGAQITIVPEPASALLVVLGAVVLTGVRRRRIGRHG